MKDLKELEKKYEELGKEIERLKNGPKFVKGKCYKSDSEVVICDGNEPVDNDCFSGILIADFSSDCDIGEQQNTWIKKAFKEVKPATWEPV